MNKKLKNKGKFTPHLSQEKKDISRKKRFIAMNGKRLFRRKKGAGFIVIEGTDGSGKTEQFKKLIARLKSNGFKVATFDFPQYEKPSSYFVKEYLNGKYGSWKKVGPHKASIFYALDRFGAGKEIKKELKTGKIVISNRYVASNMGHQGSKIKSKKQRIKLYKWLYELEFEILGIPRPMLNIVLHVPAKTAQKLVDKKGKREYLKGARRDIHEDDIGHLKQAEQAYLEIVKLFPGDFRLVECVENKRLLSIEEIHEKVWKVVKQAL